MKKLFLLLSIFSLAVIPMMAQDEIDGSYVFIDADGNVLENGATVTRTLVEHDATLDQDVIYSGISVQNVSAGSSVYLKVKYTINQIDNGSYQICFPSTCNSKTAVGTYETSPGQVSTTQSIQSEWFPQADGTCSVTLAIETLTKKSGFPPSYSHRGWGPTITINFVKGGAPEPLAGDVNLDGEVNISDVNSVIDMILSGSYSEAADVASDGEVNVSDVNAVINIILSGGN